MKDKTNPQRDSNNAGIHAEKSWIRSWDTTYLYHLLYNHRNYKPSSYLLPSTPRIAIPPYSITCRTTKTKPITLNTIITVTWPWLFLSRSGFFLSLKANTRPAMDNGNKPRNIPIIENIIPNRIFLLSKANNRNYWSCTWTHCSVWSIKHDTVKWRYIIFYGNNSYWKSPSGKIGKIFVTLQLRCDMQVHSSILIKFMFATERG